MKLFPDIRNFFRRVVMAQKIIYARVYDWQLKKKCDDRWIGRRAYVIVAAPCIFLIFGVLFAVTKKDGYVHFSNTLEEVIIIFFAVCGMLGMVIPLGFDGKKIRDEVRKEVKARPRYWRNAVIAYFVVIVAIVWVVNVVFSHLGDVTE